MWTHCPVPVRVGCLVVSLAVLGLRIPAAIGADGATNAPRVVEFREPLTRRYVIETAGPTNATGPSKASAVPTSLMKGEWTTARLAGTTNTVLLGSRIVLQLVPGQDLNALLAGRKVTVARTIRTHLFILQAADSATAIDMAESLSRLPGVRAAYPVRQRPRRHRNAYTPPPNDPLFEEQWHLENRDTEGKSAGPDLNVRAAWPVTRGDGILVAVGDDGLELDHPDLRSRTLDAPHHNFYLGTTNGGPGALDADHATAVAGLIAAEADNGIGVAGVAPRARLASWVIFGPPRFGQDTFVSDEQLMDMFQYATNEVSVQNHSWGSSILSQDPIGLLPDAGIENAITQGRGGKGEVMVHAGGNERADLANVNDDALTADPRAIAVAAVRKDGRVCSFSSPGACLLVAAPSGDLLDSNDDGLPDAPDPTSPDVETTDRTGSDGFNTASGSSGNYTGFDGTSASSPEVAGVAALILSANPNLGYRDVQHILLQSARHFDFADPDLRTNGAGFRVSHNLGFGVPDAGFAVSLAQQWSNLPPTIAIHATNTDVLDIPDDALRVLCSAADLPESLQSIHTLPSLGAHADAPTPALPLVYVGQANEELTTNLTGRGALIQRGTSLFSDKIARAARAGAAFAIIFNNSGGTDLQLMGGTEFASIPAVSIGQTDGEALRDFLVDHPDTTGQIVLTPAIVTFSIDQAVVCEHVGLRLQTTHSSRSDVRITLLSPSGTRSVLEAMNGDDSPGPVDWTYWTTHDYYEGSVGDWRLEVSDELATVIRVGLNQTSPATGSVTYAELIVQGVPITDTDHDGLDDDWEMRTFGNLNFTAGEDPDHDGFNNAREQRLGTDPLRPNRPLQLELAALDPAHLRLDWPGRDAGAYDLQVFARVSAAPVKIITVPGQFPVTEEILPIPTTNQFYRLFRRPE